MRDFTDEHGADWTATVAERADDDYKGRYHLVLTPAADGEPVELVDVRWNNERTARRTLETMSVVELRRRLRSARGRGTTGTV
jgi:hypothetical protein